MIASPVLLTDLAPRPSRAPIWQGMRIALVNSLYHPQEHGGAERAVRLLAEGLRRRGLGVSVICLAPGGLEIRDEVDGVPVIRLPLANIYWPFGRQSEPVRRVKRALWHLLDIYNPVMQARLARVLVEIRPDLVHLNNLAGFSASAIVAAQRCGLPTLQTLHDYYYACPRTTTFRGGHNCARPCGACRAYTAARKRIGRRVDLACGVSGAMLRRLEEFGAFRGMLRRAVTYGANLPAGGVPPRRVDHGRGEVLTVGFLGRLDPTKGLETLLEAAGLLRGRPMEVAIAGDGHPDYVATLRARAAGLPVRFLGHVHPERFLAEIDVLVVPSVWHEPFGRVVQEAFSCGVPVVGSAAGGIPEAIGATGPGFLFSPGASAQLAEILDDFIGQGLPAGELFDNGLRRSRDFDIEHVVEDHLRLYRQVLESGRSFVAEAPSPPDMSVGAG